MDRLWKHVTGNRPGIRLLNVLALVIAAAVAVAPAGQARHYHPPTT